MWLSMKLGNFAGNISKNKEILIFLSITKLSHKKVSNRNIFYTGNNVFYVHLKLRGIEK